MTPEQMWRDMVRKQPIDDMHIQMICDSINQITSKKNTSARLLGVLTEAKCIILRQRMAIKAEQAAQAVEGGQDDA